MSLTTSVVICAYTEHRWDQLLAAVQSVQAQVTPADEVVVVVDHNEVLLRRLRDALATTTTTSGPSPVRVLPSAGPKGLSGARNTGTARTVGDVVLFLDDDATAEPDWTTRLLAHFADQDVLGVGGAAHPVWESAAPRWWPSEFGWVVGCSYEGQPTSPAPVRNLMGCNMSIRRSVLEATGGFDSGLGRTATAPLGCEETELCIRAADLFAAGRFVFEPAAAVRHHVPRQRASWSYFRSRCRAEGVSKARVAGQVGRSAALSAEASYVRSVLPSGVARNLRQGAHGDLAAMTRAGAIVAGLAFTAIAFLGAQLALRIAGRASRHRTTESTSDDRAKDQLSARSGPIIPQVVNLSEPARPIDPRRPDGPDYAQAICLVTVAGDPIGRVRLELTSDVLPGSEVERRLRAGLSEQLAQQLRGPRPTVQAEPPLAPATVVIATRDRPELLRECLDSVLAGTVVPDRVVVVDNAPSSEATAELVAGLAQADPRLRYVREDRPGLARAHNAALPYVDTPLVAFTDDDVVVDSRWLERLARAFGADLRTTCVTGMIAPRELETLPQQWIEGNVTYDKGLRRRVFDAREHRPADPLFPYTSGAFGSGANMAFRTEDLRRRGGFDVALGTGTVAMGGDDLAAFYDVVTSGHRLVYEPAAIVLHRHHREYAGLRRQTYGYGAGLGAHLTRCLLGDPRMALRLIRHAATARRRAAGIVSPPTVAGLPPYPRDLSRAQLRGMISGPWRYLLSRCRVRRETLRDTSAQPGAVAA